MERAEDLAGVGIAVVIWASAAFAGVESVRKLIGHGHTAHVTAGIAGAVLGIIGNQLVARYKLKVGKRICRAPRSARSRSPRWRRLRRSRNVTGMSRRDQVVDVAAGVALAAFCGGLTPVTRLAQPAIRPLDAGAYILLVVAGGAVALHRRRPVAAYLFSVGAATVYLGLGFPGWPVYVGAVGGLVALTAGVPRREWVPLGAGGGVALAVATGRPEAWQPARMAGMFVVWCALMLLAGEASARRARRAEADARQRVVEERLRIARELHDVLSHSLATISLQAAVGLHLIESDPGQAREALASIRTVSKEALAQARAALSVVRGPGDGDEPAPRLCLPDVASLVASVRAAGLDVQLEADSSARGSGDVEAAAYRVVQEALTNVMRHAGQGARAWVTLRRHCDQLSVEVRDDGHGAVAGAPPGHGLEGMGERARDLGGQFTAGPHPGGGFVVRACFPAGDPS